MGTEAEKGQSSYRSRRCALISKKGCHSERRASDPTWRRSRPSTPPRRRRCWPLDGDRADRSRLRNLRAAVQDYKPYKERAETQVQGDLSVTSRCRPRRRLRRFTASISPKRDPAGLDRGPKRRGCALLVPHLGLDPNSFAPSEAAYAFTAPARRRLGRWTSGSTSCSSEIRSCRARPFPDSC